MKRMERENSESMSTISLYIRMSCEPFIFPHLSMNEMAKDVYIHVM